MYLIIYLLASIVALIFSYVSYTLGKGSTTENIEKRYLLVKWFGYITIIYFILMIPVFDDGSLIMLFINILNIILAGIVSYGYILNFINGRINGEKTDFKD